MPGVGWLAYIGDTEGNIVGLMQPDERAVPGAGIDEDIIPFFVLPPPGTATARQ